MLCPFCWFWYVSRNIWRLLFEAGSEFNFNFEVTSRLSFQNLTIFIFQVNRNYDARAIIFETLVILFDSFWIRVIGGQIFANPHFVQMFQSLYPLMYSLNLPCNTTALSTYMSDRATSPLNSSALRCTMFESFSSCKFLSNWRTRKEEFCAEPQTNAPLWLFIRDVAWS